MMSAGAHAAERVVDLLREAQSAGLSILFSDRLVPPDLRVMQEPRSTEPLERLREVLRAHALGLSELAPGAFVVVREPTMPADVPSATPERPQKSDEEVHISASRYRLGELSADAPLSLHATQIEGQPVLFNDATRSIRRFPGTAGQDLSSRTFVRGGAVEDNLVLLDGVPLYEPFHLPGLPVNFSLIDPALIASVDLYSGVLPAAYGNRMGALVSFGLREPRQDLGGRIALSALDTSALLSGPLTNERGDWIAFARRGLLGEVVRMDRPELGHPTLIDGVGRVRYRVGDDDLVTMGGVLGRDAASVRGEGGLLSEDASSGHDYIWLAYDRNSERLRARTLLMRTSIDTSRRGELRDRIGSYGSLRDDRRFESTFLQQDWTLAANGRNSVRWGVALRQERARFELDRALDFHEDVANLFMRPATASSRFEGSVALREYEAYIQASRALGRRVLIDLGAHRSHARYSTDQSASAWDPRISVRFDASPSTRLRYSFGQATQIWSAAELPVERSQYVFDAPSESYMHVLAAEHDFGSRVLMRAELFERRIEHARPRMENLFFPNAFLPELRPDRLAVGAGRSRMRGFDLYVTAKLSERISGWLSYSRSTTMDGDPSDRFTPRAWDQPHAGGLGLAWSGAASLMSVELFAHSNWPQTPLLHGSQFLPNDPTVPAWPVRLVGARDPVGEGFYFSLNLKAAHTFAFASGALRVALDVSNATNRRNVCCEEVIFYPRAGDTHNPTEETSESRRWLPLVPYLSVAWEF